MRGVSQQSLTAVGEQLEAALGSAGADAQGTAADLFAVTGVLAANPALRRGLTDPARPGAAKAEVVNALFGGKIGATALNLISALAQSRWGAAGDLTDAVETLGVSAVLASAEQNGRLEAVEDELFRFARTIAGDVGLRDAFSARTQGEARKAEVVKTLLGAKVSPESLALAVQAASAPRGVRTEQLLERFVAAAAGRRSQLVAEVTSAVPLTEQQRERLAASLQRIYGRAIQIHAQVDASVVGGLRVQVAGESVDGSLVARLSDVRRRLAS